MASLVPERECGSCTACCVVLPIVEAEIAKPSNHRCLHCRSGGGCAIYERRPEVCRDWYCGWRFMPELDEGWRPDRSGTLVKIDRETDHILMVFGNPFEAFSERFVLAVFDLIARGVPVELALPGPPGHFAHAMSLNGLLREAAKTGDQGAARGLLARVIETLSSQDWKSDGVDGRYPA